MAVTTLKITSDLNSSEFDAIVAGKSIFYSLKINVIAIVMPSLST